MSDIFISYSSEDRTETETLAHALETQGWSVWWDRSILLGEDFEVVIEEALDAAKCVVVIWSKKSVKSRWVRAEVAEAERQGKLFPLNIDDSTPPLVYRSLQTADFSCWSGDETTTVFLQLTDAIQDSIGTVVSKNDSGRVIKEEITHPREKFSHPDSTGSTENSHEDQTDGKYTRDGNFKSEENRKHNGVAVAKAEDSSEIKEKAINSSNKLSQEVPSKAPEISNIQKTDGNKLNSAISTDFHLQFITACPSQSIRELKQVKECVVNIKKLHRQGKKHLPLIELSHANSLDDAISQALTEPDTSIVLACGYSTKEIHSALATYNSKLPIVVISHPPDHTESYHRPTSSLLEEKAITRVRSLEEGIRKLVLRYVIRQLGEIRPIIEQSELEQYFSLRFRVWNDVGYIASDSALQQEGWEIDHFDRFSLPIGFFSHKDELLACCRLVQQYGCESTKNVRAISKLLEHNNKQVAAQAFSYTGIVEQPFDILCEFRGFREYYRSLVHNQSMVAEVSRVIVDPSYRGLGLAEVLVDSLVSVAKVQGIDVFMLACREALSPLYQRCGFVAVPNLVSDKFLSISEKSIVMERILK